MDRVNIFWFRRDLRLYDNAGLYFSLRENLPVVPLFIFDRVILDALDDPRDRRVEFIHQVLVRMQEDFIKLGSSLEILYGTPLKCFGDLLGKYDISSVFTNHDYEPYAIQRDGQVKEFLDGMGIPFKSFKDQVIFEKDEVIKEDGAPYSVFTPYSRKWKSRLEERFLKPYAVQEFLGNFFKGPYREIPSLGDLGFTSTGTIFPAGSPPVDIVRHYHETRDFPSLNGTSRLGIHLRFGTCSIRELVRMSLDLNSTFLNELIWREFYMNILWNFPHVGQHKSFKPAYDLIEWRNDEEDFERWAKGLTGIPIVDAGMRQLNETGYMHNRLRMVTASYLVKDLLIDWRWGESYFAGKLLDFDLAANNGGWQWASGSGCDAAPYFRIFNPDLQTKKFDKNFDFISKWVPEYRDPHYPRPIVDHSIAKIRCLETFKKALSGY